MTSTQMTWLHLKNRINCHTLKLWSKKVTAHDVSSMNVSHVRKNIKAGEAQFTLWTIILNVYFQYTSTHPIYWQTVYSGTSTKYISRSYQLQTQHISCTVDRRRVLYYGWQAQWIGCGLYAWILCYIDNRQDSIWVPPICTTTIWLAVLDNVFPRAITTNLCLWVRVIRGVRVSWNYKKIIITVECR